MQCRILEIPRINRIRNPLVSSETLSVSITHMVIVLCTTRWFGWHRISTTVICSSMVMVTLVLSMEMVQLRCGIQNLVCRVLQWNFFEILIKILSITKITMMDKRESQSFSKSLSELTCQRDNRYCGRNGNKYTSASSWRNN